MRLPCSYGEAAKYENVLFPRERDENKRVKMGLLSDKPTLRRAEGMCCAFIVLSPF